MAEQAGQRLHVSSRLKLPRMMCTAGPTIYYPGEFVQNYLQVVEIFLLTGKNMITLMAASKQIAFCKCLCYKSRYADVAQR